MIHRFARPLVLIACALLSPALLQAQPGDDGTTSEEWTLDNGLRVTIRNVPGAGAVGIVVAYDVGRADDPVGQEGLTRLMADCAFMAAADQTPSRSRAELDDLRPIGWNVQVEHTRTELAEMASKERFPGVLHQVALRMHGVKIDDAVVDQARADVRAEFEQLYGKDLGARLYAEIGVRASGRSHESFERWISGAGIEKVGTREVSRRIEELYVPANAVLSLAGDFEGVNLRAFIQREFGDIPAGTKFERPAQRKPVSFHSQVRQPGAPRTLGAVGILAPAVSDTSHPSFYLTMLVLGQHASMRWGRPNSPLRSRFNYSIFDDPSVARFYPPVKSKSWTPENLSVQMRGLAEHFNGFVVDFKAVQSVQLSVDWLLGGPLPPSLQERITKDPAVLYRVASSGAARRLIGDEAFWRSYRRQFDPTVGSRYDRWHPYVIADENHAALMYLSSQ